MEIPLYESKVSKNYRTTIPREVRKILGITRGDYIEWVLKDKEIVIRKKRPAEPSKN